MFVLIGLAIKLLRPLGRFGFFFSLPSIEPIQAKSGLCMGIRSHTASHTALALPYSPRSSSAPTKRLHASRVNMPSQLHVSGQCTEAHGSAPGKTFQQSLRNAAAEARRGDHGHVYGRAFLIQKLIQGRPARNQTILKSSIMCMGEHFFPRNALLSHAE